MDKYYEFMKNIPISERIANTLTVEFIKDYKNLTEKDLKKGCKQFIKEFKLVKDHILLNIQNKPVSK